MNHNENHKLTLEEKMERYKNSQALSPESAAIKVKKLTELDCAFWIYNEENLDQLLDLTDDDGWGEKIDIDHFGNFCELFKFVEQELTRDIRHRPVRGCKYNNAVILLLLFYIGALEREEPKENPVKSCLHMTLEDYIGAVWDLCYQEDEAFQNMMKDIKEDETSFHGTLNTPVLEALKDYFRQYMSAVTKFKYVKYMISMAKECTEFKDGWNDMPDYMQEELGSPLEMFQQRLRGFETVQKLRKLVYENEPDVVMEDGHRRIDLFYMDEDFALMTSKESLHEYCQKEGIAQEFVDYMDEILDKDALEIAMLQINILILRIEILFISAPNRIYKNDCRYEEHHEL